MSPAALGWSCVSALTPAVLADVLGFRWVGDHYPSPPKHSTDAPLAAQDCESSAQVWQACADITITA